MLDFEKGKRISLNCDNCNNVFSKPLKEYTRSQKINRKNYCSRHCAAIGNYKVRDKSTIVSSFLNKGYDRSDEKSPFRYYIKSIKRRTITKGESDITLEVLENIWKEQNGICPFSGFKLILPRSKEWKSNKDKIFRASLDRIDSNKGYVIGNVRFVSWTANVARNDISDEELIIFCKAVSAFRS